MEDEMDAYQYNSYWELKRFLDDEELNQSFGTNEMCLGLSNLTSADGAESSDATVNKAVAYERTRRKKLNDCICRLRGLVPRITKMDKASTIKDAIDYVQELQQQERQLEAEISDIKSKETSESSSQNDFNNCSTYFSFTPETRNLQPIEILQLNVQDIGQGNYLVSMACNKKNGAMSSVCEVIDYLGLTVITSNITTVSASIMFTFTVQAEELTSSQLREIIGSGISMLNGIRKH